MIVNNPQAGDGSKPTPASLFRRWLLLLAAIAMIIGFMVIAPRLERMPLVGATLQFLRERGIYVGGWYYDMVDEVAEAEGFMRRALGRPSRERN